MSQEVSVVAVSSDAELERFVRVPMRLMAHDPNYIAPLVMDCRAWKGQPWRLVTSALPHVDLLHLAFNLYWLWAFGTTVEGVFGPSAVARPPLSEVK